jgi:predicted DNA-binding ribbon-helix-helix protein
MKSAVIKRSVLVGGHRTSVSLEAEFWVGLREIATSRCVSLSHLVGEIDMNRDNENLSSALRLFVFDYVRCQAGGICPPEDAAARIAAWQAEAKC